MTLRFEEFPEKVQGLYFENIIDLFLYIYELIISGQEKFSGQDKNNEF